MSTILASKLLLSPLPLNWAICYDPTIRYGVYLFDGNSSDRSLEVGLLEVSVGILQVTYQLTSSVVTPNVIELSAHQFPGDGLIAIQSLKTRTHDDWVVAELEVGQNDNFFIRVTKTDSFNNLRLKVSCRVDGY